MLELGKLYACEEYFLLLFPDQETAVAAAHRWVTAAGAAAAPQAPIAAAYWSKRFGKAVSYAEKNVPLLPLNNKEEYVEVLAGDKKGWIIFKDWLKIREIDHA